MSSHLRPPFMRNGVVPAALCMSNRHQTPWPLRNVFLPALAVVRRVYPTPLPWAIPYVFDILATPDSSIRRWAKGPPWLGCLGFNPRATLAKVTGGRTLALAFIVGRWTSSRRNACVESHWSWFTTTMYSARLSQCTRVLHTLHGHGCQDTARSHSRVCGSAAYV